MESVVVKQHHFRKTRIAASLVTALGGLAAVPYAFGDALVPVVPPPISSYPGDPGTLGNPASWRTAEFLRDWGLRALGAEFAYAAGFAGQKMNVGVVDSGYFAANPANTPPIPVGWLPEHTDATVTNDRWIAVTADGGTTGPTPGFFNQTYNDTHGTHVSGTVAARRDGGTAPLAVTPNQPVASDMHGVSFDANVSFGNTHKTDSVYYGLQPAGAADRLLLDNAYLANVYPAVAASVNAAGTPVRIIHSSWGSQPPTENYNTYCPPLGGTQSFGLLASWQYISTPDGVADANGHTNHWLNGAIAVARSGTAIISFSAGNGGYIYTTPRGHASYFLPDLEGHWIAVSGLSTTGQTFNADGSILVPGTETFNQCGLAKWSCVTAPSNSINSTTVSVINGTPTATYGSLSGTSMAGPHSASSLNLVTQRFPYMTNDQALYTMFTTGRQNATISNASGTAVPNPSAGQMVQVPDSRNGWGTISLVDAFRGPGQFLGRFTVNTQGFSDVWSNNISDVAIKARRQEDAAEDALWQSSQVTNTCVLSLPPGSTLPQTDLAAGQARAAARATRLYTGQFVKQGNGTLFLTGANTYTGPTTAAGGKLSITGSLTSPLSVSGGTLGGSGTLTGSVSALSGIVWPGLSPDEAAFINDGVTTAADTLTVTSIKIGPAAAFATTIRSQSDYTQLRTTGTTVVGGSLMIDLQGAPPPGSVLAIVAGASPILGTFKDLPEGSILTAGSQRFRISYLNNSVTLTALDGT
ncbi:MAG TPA: S8 family serine peptidase [Casimicrobiaceae bacterium]|nr:S8 family serine peptidase [Casimicrobiaceae bacterium]